MDTISKYSSSSSNSSNSHSRLITILRWGGRLHTNSSTPKQEDSHTLTNKVVPGTTLKLVVTSTLPTEVVPK